MATETQTSDASSAGSSEPVVHILWMNGGLGCDGDSVALTAATQPSIEEIVLGALPGLPKIVFLLVSAALYWSGRRVAAAAATAPVADLAPVDRRRAFDVLVAVRDHAD